MRISDWSSDVCSSDLVFVGKADPAAGRGEAPPALPCIVEVFKIDAVIGRAVEDADRACVDRPAVGALRHPLALGDGPWAYRNRNPPTVRPALRDRDPILVVNRKHHPGALTGDVCT